MTARLSFVLLVITACLDSGRALAQQKDTPAIGPEEQAILRDYEKQTADYEAILKSAQALDLPTAFAQVDSSSPIIALAQERVNVARALQLKAQVLWLPNLQVTPLSYTRYDGSVQLVNQTFSANFFSLANEGGALLYTDTASACFQPKITRNLTAAAIAAAQGTRNQVQLQVAISYLNLQAVYAEWLIGTETATNGVYALQAALEAEKAGKTQTPADVQRLRTVVEGQVSSGYTFLALFRKQSAQLAHLLQQPPTLVFKPTDPTVVPITLVSDDANVDELIALALMNRPELSEQRSVVQANLLQWRQAKWQPLMPTLVAAYSAGGYGGGTNSTLQLYAPRGYGGAGVMWQLDNLGLGNVASIRAKRSQYNMSQDQMQSAVSEVSAEVVAVAATVRGQRQALESAQRAVRQGEGMWKQLAESGFGLKQGKSFDAVGAITAMNSLNQARNSYLRTVIGYNRAQFELYTALGQPSSDALAQALRVSVKVPVVPPTPVTP